MEKAKPSQEPHPDAEPDTEAGRALPDGWDPDVRLWDTEAVLTPDEYRQLYEDLSNMHGKKFI